MLNEQANSHTMRRVAYEKFCQVIYTTHSPIFANAVRFKSVRLVGRAPDGNPSISYVHQDSDDAKFMESIVTTPSCSRG